MNNKTCTITHSILIATLIHVIPILLIIMGLAQHVTQELLQQAPTKQPMPTWSNAALNAGNRSGGAPVVLMQQPPPPPIAQESVAQEPDTPAPDPTLAPLQEEISAPPPTPHEQKLIAQEAPSAPPPTVQKTIRKRRHRRLHRSSTQPKPIFKNFAQEFMQFMHNQGEDLIARTGDSTLRPDEAERKRIAYQAKFLNHLNSAYAAAAEALAGAVQRATITNDLIITLSIEKNGHLNSLHMLQSSGDQYLDRIYSKMITSSAPFPPLPDHLGVERMPQQIIIDTNALTHPNNGAFIMRWGTG